MNKETNTEMVDVENTPDITPAEEPKKVVGVVNCARLNIRRRPRVADNVVTIVAANSKLEINTDKSNKEWFKVRTESGIEGFCMKKFVTVIE